MDLKLHPVLTTSMAFVQQECRNSFHKIKLSSQNMQYLYIHSSLCVCMFVCVWCVPHSMLSYCLCSVDIPGPCPCFVLLIFIHVRAIFLKVCLYFVIFLVLVTYVRFIGCWVFYGDFLCVLWAQLLLCRICYSAVLFWYCWCCCDFARK